MSSWWWRLHPGWGVNPRDIIVETPEVTSSLTNTVANIPENSLKAPPTNLADYVEWNRNITLDFQNPSNTLWRGVKGTPEGRASGGVKAGPNTDPHMVFERLGSYQIDNLPLTYLPTLFDVLKKNFEEIPNRICCKSAGFPPGWPRMVWRLLGGTQSCDMWILASAWILDL